MELKKTQSKKQTDSLEDGETQLPESGFVVYLVQPVFMTPKWYTGESVVYHVVQIIQSYDVIS